MNKKQLMVAWVMSFFWIASALAYYENYPPYKFNQAPYKHLNAEPLADKDYPPFIKKNSDLSSPHRIYKFDIDGNGLEDFIVLLHQGATSLGDEGEIYLKRQQGGYQKISYESSGIWIEDFTDINRDGRYEVIITDIYAGEKHNYFVYDVYEFKDYRLVNADNKFKGFPKFVWMTNKPNDKDTVHLTKEARSKHVEEKNRGIKYEVIK